MSLLGQLIFTLGVDKRPFDRGLDSAKASVGTFASQVRGHLASMFSVGAITAWLKHITDAVTKIKDLSEQFGVSTDEVQKTEFALQQSGVHFEELTMALNRLSQARREAVETGGELRKTFEKFGISLERLNNPAVRTFDLLQDIAKATATGNLTAKEQVALIDLLGGRAIKLVNVLKNLETIKPPKLIAPKDIEEIDKAAKALDRLKIGVQSIGGSFLGGYLRQARETLSGAMSGKLGDIVSLLNPMELIIKANRRGIMNAAGMESNSPATSKPLSRDEIGEAALKMLGMVQKVFWNNPGELWDVDSKAKAVKEPKASTAGASGRIGAADSLVAVGNFLGGDPLSAMKREMMTVVDRLNKIERHTKKTADGAVTIRK